MGPDSEGRRFRLQNRARDTGLAGGAAGGVVFQKLKIPKTLIFAGQSMFLNDTHKLKPQVRGGPHKRVSGVFGDQ